MIWTFQEARWYCGLGGCLSTGFRSGREERHEPVPGAAVVFALSSRGAFAPEGVYPVLSLREAELKSILMIVK